MGPLDAFWHLVNFIAAAVGIGGIAAVLAKLVWRHDLAAVPWKRLATWACGATAAASVAGLVVLGRDGRMATYGAMIAACAIAMWWVGFGPGRR
jgi:hypothetical protein